MGTEHPDDLNAFEPDGLSRRDMLVLGVGGLAFALVAQGSEAALAQDATPAADSGMPEGLGFASLGGAPVRDLPTKPFTIQVARVTLEPGALAPNSSAPYPSLTHVEEGEGVVCPPGGEGRWIYDSEGKVVASGAGEYPFPLGTWCYTAPDTMDGARNDGSEQASLLIIDLVPTES